MSSVTTPPLLPQLLSANVRMFAISSSLNWLIGGMTELKALPFTVTGPLRPLSTMPIARLRSATRKSDLASGGNTLGIPAPVSW